MENTSVVECLDIVGGTKLGMMAIFDGHNGKGIATEAKAIVPKLIKEHIEANLEAGQLKETDFDNDPYQVAQILKAAFDDPDPRSNHDYAGIAGSGYSWPGFNPAPEAPPEALHKDGTKKLVSAKEETVYSELLRSLPNDNQSGSAAIVAVFLKGYIYLLNMGNSRAMLVQRNGSSKRLSIHHTPKNQQAKIHQLGGFSMLNSINGPSPSDGIIAKKGRLLGHHRHILPRRPEVTWIRVDDPDNGVLMLGCDGMFEEVLEDAHAEYIDRNLTQGKSLEKIAKELISASYQAGSGSNMSVMLANLARR